MWETKKELRAELEKKLLEEFSKYNITADSLAELSI